MLFGKPTDYARNNARIIIASLHIQCVCTVYTCYYMESQISVQSQKVSVGDPVGGNHSSPVVAHTRSPNQKRKISNSRVIIWYEQYSRTLYCSLSYARQKEQRKKEEMNKI